MNHVSNLQTQHILRSQRYSCVAESNSTAIVVITLKTVSNEKVGYQFCQVTVAQPEWDWRGHGLPETKLLRSLLVLCLYQFSAVRK